MPKTVVEKLSFSELKIEKVKFFAQSPTNIFCITVFNVGGYIVTYLTFKPFLMSDPSQLSLKRAVTSHLLVASINLSLINIYYNNSRR